MTKYRIRLKNGRVIGPFVKDQLLELKVKGHIQGTEDAQLFPTGDWKALTHFDFYQELMKESQPSGLGSTPKEETFVIDLAKLRNQKNEKEVEALDIEEHLPVESLTETIQLQTSQPEPSINSKFEIELDHHLAQATIDLEEIAPEVDQVDQSRGDKTTINPIAQKDLERIRKAKKEEEQKQRAEEEQKKQKEEEEKRIDEARKLIAADESTQMIKLDSLKNELILSAQEEEKVIEKVEKEIKKRKRKEEAEKNKEDEEEEENTELAKKKKMKLFGLIAVGFILYAIFFPGDEVKPKKPPFKHIEPIVDFPVPFDKADTKRAKIDFDKARILFARGDYQSIIAAGILLKNSYENNIESDEIVSLLVRDYAEQLQYSREEKQSNALVIFNMIQSKRPFLAKDPNGVIGLNLFYMTINKPEAAADVVSRYLKLYPKNVTQDLFAAYLHSLLKLGRLDLAKQFSEALVKVKASDKNRYTLDALIELALLNQESELAMEYVNEGIKKFPHLVGFYLKKADLLLREKKFKEVEPLLGKCEDLGLEHNDLNRAKYLHMKGLFVAQQGDVKKATTYFAKSLEIEDSIELRMRLADLASSDDIQSDTDKLIAESKSIKLLNQAKDFFEKRSYELAVSYAAKASDAYPGYIPAELFLAKVQLRLGLAKQALKTLEDLIKKYPEDKSINLALIDTYIETFKFNDAKTRIGVLSGTDFKNSYEFASVNGRLYMQMGDPLQAISWFRNSINLNPLNDQDIFWLAELLIKRANFDAARILLNKCMELDPINPDYRIAYSKIVYEQQDDLEAIGYLLGLINEFGDNPKILAEIAIFYYRAGKIKDFQAYKEKLEKLPTKDKSLYEFLIKAALLDERYAEIPELVENLLRIEPGELEAMMTVGKVLFEDGKLVEAAKWFKRIQDKLETYPKVQYYNAKIEFLKKDYDSALKYVLADLKTNGDNDADLTLMAQIYVEKGDLTEAENLFKKAQKINPKAFDSLMGLADISTKRNNFDLALDLYKKAMNIKGDEPIIHKKIGDVYRLLGQGALAVESYKLYLEMNPEASDKNQIESYINLMQ